MSARKASAAEIPDSIIEEGVEDLNEAKEVIPYNFEITSYGADYDVEGLVRRMTRGDILVPTFDPQIAETESGIVGFQRRYVWRKPQADRFIESLLLGLPVPGIFLVREPSGVLLVLDGQQRLRTLESFYRGVLLGKEFRLDLVQERFRGLMYDDLEDDDRRRIDDAIVHATVVRQDTPTEDQESVYLLFERLNTGGTSLQPQEIRVALYHGRLAGVLRDLNEDENWRAIYGKRSDRLKDQELILRFFAMLYYGDQYERPMKVFLNRYMATNRDLRHQSEEEMFGAFGPAVKVVRDAKSDRAFRLASALNAAIFDSVLTGVAHRLADDGPIEDLKGLGKAYDRLLRDRGYLGAVERATADEDSVKTRLAKAHEAFARVS
ncbi:MAG: DUF262 domain-containing protein [Actinomycetota bacterium]|nr:DUF262 domain-containing protein [Actinomycetota bacterium]MDQ5808013.1 DUF262 domain-containing protein [Actinomycetota bacterium]